MHTFMFIRICQFTIADSSKAIAIGKSYQDWYRDCRIGRIDKIQVKRIALTVFIGIRIVINTGVILIIGYITADSIALHKYIGTRWGAGLSTKLPLLKTTIDGYDILVQLRGNRFLALRIVDFDNLPAVFAQPSHIVSITDLTDILEAEIFKINHRHWFPINILRWCRRCRRGCVLK